jgi:hypothetical protein
LIADDST